MPARILKTNEEIALLLTLKPGRTEAGKALSARIVARLEIAMWIDAALNA